MSPKCDFPRSLLSIIYQEILYEGSCFTCRVLDSHRKTLLKVVSQKVSAIKKYGKERMFFFYEIDRVLDSEGCNNRNSSRPKEVLQLLDVVGDLLKENNVSDATALLFICTQLIVSKLGQTDNYLPQSSKSFVSVRQSANADVHATPFRCVINWVT